MPDFCAQEGEQKRQEERGFHKQKTFSPCVTLDEVDERKITASIDSWPFFQRSRIVFMRVRACVSFLLFLLLNPSNDPIAQREAPLLLLQ